MSTKKGTRELTRQMRARRIKAIQAQNAELKQRRHNITDLLAHIQSGSMKAQNYALYLRARREKLTREISQNQNEISRIKPIEAVA